MKVKPHITPDGVVLAFEGKPLLAEDQITKIGTIISIEKNTRGEWEAVTEITDAGFVNKLRWGY